MLFSWKGMYYIVKKLLNNGKIFLYSLYILSPIDILPEFLLGPVGLIDDLAVFGLLLKQITNILY